MGKANTIKVDPLEQLQRYTSARHVLNEELGYVNVCVARINKCMTEKCM